MHPSNHLTAGAKLASDIFSEFEGAFATDLLPPKLRRRASYVARALYAIASHVEQARESPGIVTYVDGISIKARIKGTGMEANHD